MTNHTRIARALACAALLAIPASAVGAQATIRIEGGNATILPETVTPIPGGGTVQVAGRPVGGATSPFAVSATSATAQLLRASQAAGIPVGFDIYGFGTFVMDVAADTTPIDWSSSWGLKVNHVDSNVGADLEDLSQGGDVLWYFGPGSSSELDVTGPATPIVDGQRFTVSVRTYNRTGAATPAAGATVTYGAQSETTGPDGTVTLTARGSGWDRIVAAAPSAIRDSAPACTYPASNPTVCDLPAAAAPAPTQQSNQASPGIIVPVTISTDAGPVTITADIPLPTPGAPPVAIRRSMITGADLTPAEMRRALGAVASAVAAQLNARAAAGQGGLSLPAGVTWQAAWLSGTPYVAPLRQGEALLGIRRDGPRNGAAIRERARAFARHMDRCDIDGTATAVTRHGYAMTAILPARARTAVVRCASGEAPR